MRVSKMGMKNVKLSNLDDMYPAQDILIREQSSKTIWKSEYMHMIIFH